MKTLEPFIALAVILIISSISAILYLNQNYISSVLLTVIWVVAITHWIGKRAITPDESR